MSQDIADGQTTAEITQLLPVWNHDDKMLSNPCTT